ncbi:MAG: twin-arginine translocation signal domain-containing protein [Chloroflexota bacterium]
MSVKKTGKQRGKERTWQKAQPISRRHFLKEAGLIVGGVAIASLALNSACASPENTNTAGTTTNTPTPSTTVTTSPTTSLPPADGFVYITPGELPPMIPVPGCTTFTATDRKYIAEHMWVKLVAENIVVVGITDKMSLLMDKIYTLYLPEIGHSLTKDGFFGSGEAAKMNVEFISPVSGTVLQLNNEIWPDPEVTVNNDPYVSGWMVTIELSKPEEWAELLTPQEYTDLNAKVL